MITTKRPKVKLIPESEVTKEDIKQYAEASRDTDMLYFSSNDLKLDNPKRIITIPTEDDAQLMLVNPTIQPKTGTQQIIYFEVDTHNANKSRKTIRHKDIVVTTENIGTLEFGTSNEAWKNMQHFLEDMEMRHCANIQRLVDAINGIDITHSSRKYTTQISNKEKVGRNERVMMESPNGETIFVKNKKADIYRDRGYRVLN